jgi:hypothetical protein
VIDKRWLIVFIAWRAALVLGLMVGTVVLATWKGSILMFAAGALAVDTAYLVAAARERPRRRRPAPGYEGGES